MLDRLQGVLNRYQEINEELMQVGLDYQRAADLAIEKAEVEPLALKALEYQQAQQQIEEARVLSSEEDEEIRLLAQSEIETLEQKLVSLEKELKSMLVPKDKRDDRNVIVEIRAGAGGDEAGLFAADLYRMYNRYAETRRWNVELLSESETGIGGYKEVIFTVKGRGAYSRMKFESGVHRVQRVPATEASGRIPYLHRHCRRAGRSGRSGSGHSRKRYSRRSLSLLRRRRSERPEELHRRPHHPPADRHGGSLPG
jgi:peptide chain release factor 1